MDLALVIVGAGVVAIAIIVTVLIGRSRTRAVARQRDQDRVLAGELSELERTAGQALVRTDERIRLADDELGFAIADFGDDAIADFAPALDRARQRLGEAFHLNQLLSDHVIDTHEQRREWSERIISLCHSADAAVNEQHSALNARRTAARRTPSQIDKVRAHIRRVRDALPQARTTVDRLSERYSDAALAPISANAEQAEQLLAFAERSAQVAESRLSDARDGEASTAVQAGAETVQRAEALLAAVSGFEVEALQAESTLTAMVAESNVELAEARALPESDRRGRIDTTVAALELALAGLPAAGAALDPVGSLAALRRANTALDDAVAERARGTERKERLRAQLVTAIDDAERQIAAARESISDYRAPVGPDARTRLAEAERELADITEERDPESAITRARRASSLAADAGAYARADIESAQRPGRGSPRGGGYGRPGADMLGGVLGGLAIGGLLEGLGDMGDFFD